MAATPSPKGSKSSWTPWSQEHMAGRFCCSCSKESLVVKCGGCSEVGLETWYCPDCLESDEECARCMERENFPSFMSPLSSTLIQDALSNRGPNTVLDFGVFKSALEASDSISDSMTNWLPTLISDYASMATGGFYGDTEPQRRKSAPPERRPSPPPMPVTEHLRRHTAPSPLSQKYVSNRQFVQRDTQAADSSVFSVDEEFASSSSPVPPPPPPPPTSSPPPLGATSRLPVPVCSRAASHPLTAILRKLAEEQDKVDGKMKVWAEEVDVCAICLEPPDDPLELPCKHSYCSRCVSALRERQLKQVCPLCRVPLPSGSETSDALYEDASRLFLPVQRAVERGRCTWHSLPPALQLDLDKSMALLRKASSEGHPRAKECLGIGKRVLLQGLTFNSVEFVNIDNTSASASITRDIGQAEETVDTANNQSNSDKSSTSPKYFSSDAWSTPWSSTSIPTTVKNGDKGQQNNLVAKIEALNGAEGVACEFDESTNRFVVQLKSDGQKVRVRAENIRMER